MRVAAHRTITTVRHSTTAHNAAQIISGRLDEPLSDIGRALAHQMVAEVGHLAADHVVSSPMRRALETAVILTRLDADDVMTDPLCVERDYGVLQGLEPAEVVRYADRIRYLRVGGIDHSLNPPGGESFEQVRERAERFLAGITALPVGSVLIVAHQVFLQQVHGILVGLDVHACLALDIRALQIDRFDFGADGTRHTTEFPGMGTDASW